MARRKRKKLLPMILLSLIFWVVFGFFMFLVDPEIVKDFPFKGFYFPFFFSLFGSVFLTFFLIFSSMRRGLLISLGLTAFLYLRLLGLGHILNLILLGSFLLVLELAVSSRS